jgi:hypothetical protein
MQSSMSSFRTLHWRFAAVNDGKSQIFLLGSAAMQKCGFNWREFSSNSKTKRQKESRRNRTSLSTPIARRQLDKKLHMTKNCITIGLTSGQRTEDDVTCLAISVSLATDVNDFVWRSDLLKVTFSIVVPTLQYVEHSFSHIIKLFNIFTITDTDRKY